MSYQLTQKSIDLEVDMSAAQKLVLIVLCRFADEAGQCFPTNAMISSKSGLNERTVMRAVKSLVEEGWLSFTQHPGKPRFFQIDLTKLQSQDPCIKQQGTPVQKCTPVQNNTPVQKCANPCIKRQGTPVQKCTRIEHIREQEKNIRKKSELNFYDVSESVLTDWKQLRKNKKAVISQSVIDDLKKKADQMRALGHYEWNLEAIMREQVVRNWQGFRPEWVLGKGEHAKELPQLELTPEAKARRRAEALRAQQSAQRMQEDEDPNGVFEDIVGQVWEEVKRAPD